jgi:hypothetical protein
MKRNTPIKIKMGLMLLYTFLFLVGLLAPLPANTALASVSCFPYRSPYCNGLNPHSTSCDVTTSTNTVSTVYNYLFSSYGVRVKEHTSSECNAAWEVTVNESGSSKYAGGSERYGGSNYNNDWHVSSAAVIANGSYVYTPMLSPETTTPSLPCGRVQDIAFISQNFPLQYWCRGQ